MKIAIAGLFVGCLAFPAFAQDAARLVPAPTFDKAAWQAEFDAGDTDGDGKLSREEIRVANPRALEIFDKTDTDGDGYISPEEDKAALFHWYRDRAAGRVQPNPNEIEVVTAGPALPEGYVATEADNNEPDTGPLAAALQERFRDRIAGIYIERESDFHVVVRLTGDRDAGTLQYQLGEDQVRVEVRTGAPHTVEQLRAAFEQRETIARFLPAGYGGYVDERTGDLVLTVDIGSEIAVASEAALADALGVPVRIIEQARAVTGRQDVAPIFVRNAIHVDVAHQALMKGLLMVDDAGCIRIGNDSGEAGPFVIWHHDSTIEHSEDGRIRITDGFTGNAIHIGSEIALGGSGGPDAPSNVTPSILAACAGEYWMAGQLMSEAERQGMLERDRNRVPVPLPLQAVDTIRQ